jgi:hypothetical protein
MEQNEQAVKRVIELARRNIAAGVITEPRVYFDEVTLPASTSQIGFVDTDIFRNGEEYPVRIYAMTASISIDSTPADERQIQRVGMRLIFHDSYYMQRDFVALPSWQNKCVAAAHALTYGQSSWRLHRPFVFSSRDSMDVQTQLRTAPVESRDVTFSMTGIGMDSMRPYFKADTLTLSVADTPTPFDPENLRNDGAEPILITEVDVHCSANNTSSNPQGDIRVPDISIRQVGNGTQAFWMNGAPGTSDLCPAVLLGRTTGRALVHEFPGEGLLWEPGEGLRIEFQALNSSMATGTGIVAVSLIGSIEVL